MAARRLILAMLVLLVLSSIAAALVPVGNGGSTSDSSTSTTTSTAPAPTGQLVKRTIAVDPKTARIRIEVGDQLELTVRSKRADQVEIPAFGELENVDPDFPAHFDILALEPGRFEVRLDEANRPIATIEVGKRRQPSSNDSPGSSTTASTAGASSATAAANSRAGAARNSSA
jgi:hypothetical protein